MPQKRKKSTRQLLRRAMVSTSRKPRPLPGGLAKKSILKIRQKQLSSIRAQKTAHHVKAIRKMAQHKRMEEKRKNHGVSQRLAVVQKPLEQVRQRVVHHLKQAGHTSNHPAVRAANLFTVHHTPKPRQPGRKPRPGRKHY